PGARMPMVSPGRGVSRRHSEHDIPIIVEDIGEVSLDEPVVALRAENRKPPGVPSDSEIPVHLESEPSQPVGTIERFPDVHLEADRGAELEAELSQVLGPADGGGGGGGGRATERQEHDRSEADFLDLSMELGLDMPPEESFKQRPITGTRIPTVEAL